MNGGSNRISGYTTLPPGDPNQLKSALNLGPISVGVQGDQDAFRLYSGGILDNVNDCGKDLNHAILAIGYGYDTSLNEEYFLIKNQWGTGWGENGYVRISTSANDVCGVLDYAQYAFIN